MQRKVLIVPFKEYIGIEEFMGKAHYSRQRAFRDPLGTEEDFKEYQRQWALQVEFRKNFLRSKNIPLDTFVETVKNRRDQTFIFTWWE